jgi:hypothetical protein
MVKDGPDPHSPAGWLAQHEQIRDNALADWLRWRSPETQLALEQAEEELQRVKDAQAHGAKLVAERAEQQEREAQERAELEARLAPIKQRERRDWLIAHPDQDDKGFEKVWPLILERLLEAERQEQIAAIQARLNRNAGRYTL